MTTKMTNKMTNKMTTNKPPIAPERHSTVAGGSTAARVMACPGSVDLCKQAPSMPTSGYAKEGSMMHAAIAVLVQDNLPPHEMLGFVHDGVELDSGLLEEKLIPALDAFDTYINALEDETGSPATILVEQEVSFGRYIPGAFGSCDVLVRSGGRVVVLDWKFGRGVQVQAEENAQLLFYAAAAARTPALSALFDDAEDVDLVIIQPPGISVWQTTLPRLSKFEHALKDAVTKSQQPGAKISAGDHCRWCPAKGAAVCPEMNGALERAVLMNGALEHAVLMSGAQERAVLKELAKLDVTKLGKACEHSYILEHFIKDLRQMVQTALENGVAVPGWKLVDKRAPRKWAVDDAEITAEFGGIGTDKLYKTELLSPAQMEKVLKEYSLVIPAGLLKTVSSGHTLAPESDKRPSVLGKLELKTALDKIKKGGD